MAKTLTYEELKELVDKAVTSFKLQADSNYSIASKMNAYHAEKYCLAAEDYEDLAKDFCSALYVMHNAHVYDNCKKFGFDRKPGSPMTHYIFTALNYDGKVVHLVDVTTYLP